MTRVLVNPLRDHRAVSPPSTRAPLGFHRRLPLYRPGPLLDLPELAAELGVGAVWVKDESSRFGLPAFKMIGASWATYRALARRLGGEPAWTSFDDLVAAVRPLAPLTLATATDGNHGRAVARVAALLGLGAHVLVPEGTAPARVDAIAGEGARVEVVAGSYDDAVARAAALASDRVLVVSDTSWPGYHEIPGWVMDGYSTIFAEVDDGRSALGLPDPDVVVVQSGVGALATAAARWARTVLVDDPCLVVVEPDTADCALRSAAAGRRVEVPGPHRSIMAGLNCGTVSEIAWPELAAEVDVFVAIDDAAAERAMRRFDELGVVAGETGAAGLAGLAELLATDRPAAIGPGARVLLLLTEGATDPATYARVVGHAPS